MLIQSIKAAQKAGKPITPENVQATAAKTTFGIDGLFGADEVPGVDREAHTGLHGAGAVERHIVGTPSSPTPARARPSRSRPASATSVSRPTGGPAPAGPPARSASAAPVSSEPSREELHRVAHADHPEGAAAVGDRVVYGVAEQGLRFGGELTSNRGGTPSVLFSSVRSQPSV